MHDGLQLHNWEHTGVHVAWVQVRSQMIHVERASGSIEMLRVERASPQI
jgi:hypothetical protein